MATRTEQQPVKTEQQPVTIKQEPVEEMNHSEAVSIKQEPSEEKIAPFTPPHEAKHKPSIYPLVDTEKQRIKFRITGWNQVCPIQEQQPWIYPTVDVEQERIKLRITGWNKVGFQQPQPASKQLNARPAGVQKQIPGKRKRSRSAERKPCAPSQRAMALRRR